jgi:hypothetical protein
LIELLVVITISYNSHVLKTQETPGQGDSLVYKIAMLPKLSRRFIAGHRQTCLAVDVVKKFFLKASLRPLSEAYCLKSGTQGYSAKKFLVEIL